MADYRPGQTSDGRDNQGLHAGALASLIGMALLVLAAGVACGTAEAKARPTDPVVAQPSEPVVVVREQPADVQGPQPQPVVHVSEPDTPMLQDTAAPEKAVAATTLISSRFDTPPIETVKFSQPRSFALSGPSLVEANEPPPSSSGSPSSISMSAKVANEGDLISFDGSFTDPGILDTHTVKWNFGDGVQTMGVLDPTHAYGDNGSYTVTLEVTDSDGGTGIATMGVTVNNVPPSVGLGFAKLVSEGEIIGFKAVVDDPGELDTHTFRWQFVPGENVDGGSEMSFSYPDDGTYTVTVEAIDDDGGTGITTVSVTVQNEPPVVEVGPDQTADEGSVVGFRGSFMDPGIMDTHTFAWDFGDGTRVVNTLAPTHVYEDDGEYTVTLKVTDNDGGVGSDTLLVKVVNKPPVVQINP